MKAQKLLRSYLMIAALVPAGLIGACTAKVGPSSGSMSNSAGPGGGGGSSGATTGGGSGPSGGGSSSGGASGGSGGMVNTAATGMLPTAPVPESAGVLPMRALTYKEYANMLTDLINNTSNPTAGWSPEAPQTSGFVAPTNLPELIIDNINTVSDTVVEAALAAGSLSIPCTNPATSAAETTCLQSFITTFGLRAYRRPIAAAEMTDLTALFTTVRGLGLSFTESVAAVVKGMIQSPNFLYHWEIGPTPPTAGPDGLVPLTQWQVASRLASTLWQSMPDNTLLQAAQAGQLSTPAQVQAQAQRLLADTTGHAANALYDFHFQLLFAVGTHDLDLTQLGKTTPVFTAAAAAGIVPEFTQFLSSVYSTGDGTLNTLLTATYSYVNHDLAAIYGVTTSVPATGFTKVQLPAAQRSGLLTQTAYLAANANDARDNPVFRGLGIYMKLMCGVVGSPPNNVPSVNFMTGSGTTRSAYEAHAASACAQGCHNYFDPPGFAFENYDGDGVYRTTDTGLPVDATGTFTTPAMNTISFKSAMDLMPQLVQSPEVQQCMARQWARYSLGRLETSAELGSLQLAYQKGLATTGYSLTGMLESLLSSKSFMYRALSPGEQL